MSDIGLLRYRNKITLVRYDFLRYRINIADKFFNVGARI
jgi:hypothetical protein